MSFEFGIPRSDLKNGLRRVPRIRRNKMNKNTKLILLVISALVLIIIFREEIKLVLTIIGIFVVAGLILQWLDKNKH